MPPAATKSKYGKNLLVLPFDPAHPQGHVMSVKCEEPIDELTVQVWLPYHHLNFKLGDNTFVIEWFAGINCIILWSQI